MCSGFGYESVLLECQITSGQLCYLEQTTSGNMTAYQKNGAAFEPSQAVKDVLDGIVPADVLAKLRVTNDYMWTVMLNLLPSFYYDKST